MAREYAQLGERGPKYTDRGGSSKKRRAKSKKAFDNDGQPSGKA
jgi:hypothetical protein